MHIGIIGNGFCGLMTCHHLVNLGSSGLKISIFEKQHNPGKGIAYSPQSEKVLLNVIASKMSAFPDNSEHFVDWLCSQSEYDNEKKQLIANSFIPRYKYGEYLSHVWKETISLAEKKGILVYFYQEEIIDLNMTDESISILSSQLKEYNFDKIILSTGNQLPRNPSINQNELIHSPRYFQNPWNFETEQIDSEKPIFILGNGLTMVDTVIQIREKKNKKHHCSCFSSRIQHFTSSKFQFQFFRDFSKN